MRIDAHHHLWRYEPESFAWISRDAPIACDFSPTLLDAELAAAGIDGAIAVQARQCEAETDFLLGCAEINPKILGVVGWIDLRAPDVEDRLAACADRRVVGFRHVAQDEPDPDFLLGDAFVRGVGAVLAGGRSYDLLISPAQLATAPRFLDRIGPGRLILDHAAKPAIRDGAWSPWAEQISAIAAFPHLYCKVSGLVTEADHARWRPQDLERYLEHIFSQFGPERIIWGSDWPVCLLAATYRQTFDLVADFLRRHHPGGEASVFGGAARRAYALQEAGQ